MTDPMHSVNKGIKRNESEAFSEHLQFCERISKKSAWKYPWELGLLHQLPQLHELPKPIGMTPLIPIAAQQEDATRQIGDEAKTSLCRKFITRQPQIDWEVKLNSLRDAAIVRWQKILMRDPMSFEVSKLHLASTSQGFKTCSLAETLRNVMSSKSSSTLNNRAGPLLRYVHHCECTSVTAFPMNEPAVYAYMLHEECNDAAPTYLKSFLSSLAFSLHVLGLHSAKHILESQRIVGLASKCFLMKRKTRSRLPLLVQEVGTLENIVLGFANKSLPDRHAAGCFLFMLFARARFSDMMNVTSLKMEAVRIDGTKVGFLETEVHRSKTSFSMDRKVRLLPMSASIRGFMIEPWGEAWLQVMKDTGIQIGEGKPLLPGRTQDGWHTLPLSAEAGTHWLRTLLRSGEHFDPDRIPGIGTHSLKSTCLSWMSKWGSSPDVRRYMGYHVADKMSTMMIYGKDNTSAGLRELEKILESIRTQKFLPDAPRAAMFPGDLNERAACQDVEELESDCSSSEDSADEDMPNHCAVEEAEQKVVGRFDGGIDVDLLPRNSCFFRHNISRILHLQEDESGLKFICGRDINAGYLGLQTRPQTLIPVCKQCFGKFTRKRS